jgi:hypothetical protein
MSFNLLCQNFDIDCTQNPDHNEISLAIVPRDHPLIITATFEAETLGLLDRLLSVFQESSRYVYVHDYMSTTDLPPPLAMP